MFIKNKLKSLKDLIKVLSFTSRDEKLKIIRTIFFVILGGFFEICSISILLPLISTLVGEDLDSQSKSLNSLINLTNGIGQENIALFLVFLFTLTSIVGALIRVYNTYLCAKVSADIGVSITDKALNSSIRKPYEFYIKNGTNHLISTFTNKPGEVSVSIQNILLIISSSIILISIIITLIIIELKITLITLIGLFSTYWYLNSINSSRVKYNSKQMAYDTDNGMKSIQETFRSIREITISNNQDYFRNYIRKYNNSVRTKYAENSFYGSFPKLIIEPIGIILILLSLIIKTRFDQTSLIIALPSLGSIIFGFQKLLPLIQVIYSNYISLISNLHIVKDVISNINKEDYLKKKYKKLSFTRGIFFKNVYFSYSTKRGMVLENLNLSIPRGAKIGLIGESGSGKSTFLDLLLGLIKPISGDIYIDNINIASKEKISKSWQKNLSNVSQEIIIHDTTIVQNIALGEELNDIDYKLIENCINIVQLKELIDNLPDGLMTVCGEMGISLSGGQCQRIGIARALYKKREILILDEATNRLDIDTEKKLIDSIMKNQELTIIIVSHRESTLKLCETIYKVQNKSIQQLIP
tara:strand:- start:12109 stop:13860 length:1752 start_codon:yes stop_codon:yes gene_type:complete